MHKIYYKFLKGKFLFFTFDTLYLNGIVLEPDVGDALMKTRLLFCGIWGLCSGLIWATPIPWFLAAIINHGQAIFPVAVIATLVTGGCGAVVLWSYMVWPTKAK